MAESDKKVTFELKDLSYDELIDSYLEVCEFLSFLDDIKLNVKAKVLTGDKKEGETTEEEGETQETETKVDINTEDTPEEEESK